MALAVATGRSIALLGILGVGFASIHRSPGSGAPRVEMRRGLAVTYQSAAGGEAQAQRARLLALHVERGESPTPFLPPGMFGARFEGTVQVPLRDRYRFRVEGKGKIDLQVNGAVVLKGTMMPGRAMDSEQVRLKKGDNQIVAAFESSALGEATLRFYWSSLDFVWEPIPPEAWSYAHDQRVEDGERLREGHTLFVERRCARCHLPEAGEAAGTAVLGELGPDLRRTGARLLPSWMVKWLIMPARMRTDVRMPRLHGIGEPEAHHIATYLRSLGEKSDGPVLGDEQQEEGALRFRELGCIACHLEPGAAAPEGDHRIELALVAMKWRTAALIAYLRDPRAEHPGVRMPAFDLSAEDATALAAFLLRGRTEEPEHSLAGDAAKGAELAAQQGCVRCHSLDLEDRSTFPALKSLDGSRGCLADTPTAAPDHGFTPPQRQALRAFLPWAAAATARNAPMDLASRSIASLRCTACHGLDGDPSIWAGVVREAARSAPVPPEEDPVAQGVPPLTWVGGKLQPGWTERFVTGQEPSPRPWLVARMPNFHEAGAAIVRGLVRQHGYPAQDERPVELNASLAAHGARLVKMGEGFGCVTCHAVAGQAPVSVFERQGIDLALAGRRLRSEYFTRWMADPPRVDAEARMPRYADDKGRTAFTDVLGGEAAAQFEAIWHYLRSL